MCFKMFSQSETVEQDNCNDCFEHKCILILQFWHSAAAGHGQSRQQNLTAAPNGFFETLLLRHFYVFYLQIDKERVYLAV